MYDVPIFANIYDDVSVLLGKTLTSIEENDRDILVFTTTEGERWMMYHSQDCCEYVIIEDIAGDLDDLIGSPLTQAEAVSSLDGFDEKPLSEYDESYTWTFYKFATIKGSVTIRWYGSSNGYYSESVNFVKMVN